MVNVCHQEGEHKNLFDFQMLSLELSSAGFVGIKRASEDMLLNEFKDIPLRNDDFHSVYVFARKFVWLLSVWSNIVSLVIREFVIKAGPCPSGRFLSSGMAT